MEVAELNFYGTVKVSSSGPSRAIKCGAELLLDQAANGDGSPSRMKTGPFEARPL